MFGFSSFAQYPFASIEAPPNVVSITISGVSATSASGSVAVARDNTLTGVSSTSTTGIVSLLQSISETGQNLVLSQNNVYPAVSPTFTGVVAAGTVGTVSPTTTVSISGVSAIAYVNSVADSVGSRDLTAVSATGTVGSVAIARDRGIAGVSAAITAGTAYPTVFLAVIGNIAIGSVGTLTPRRPWAFVPDNQDPNWINIDSNVPTIWGNIGTVEDAAWELIDTEVL